MTTLGAICILFIVSAITVWGIVEGVGLYLNHRTTKPQSLARLRRHMTDRKHITLDIDIIAISAGTQRFGNMDVESNNWIAACTIGGITFRGTRATDAITSVQALLMTLANPQVRNASEPDPVVGLSMAMQGTTIDQVVGAPTGQPSASEISPPAS